MNGGQRPLPAQTEVYARVFERGYGHDRSLAVGRPVSSVDAALPAVTYPALEFLRQLELANASVLALDETDSLPFWCRAARDVTAVIGDEAACAAAAALGLGNLTVSAGAGAAIPAEDARPSVHDVVLVDGADRPGAAAHALRRLAWGGMVILHLADRYPAAARRLRDGDLIEIDFTGFAPLERRPVTTAVFLHRAFDKTSRAGRRPLPGVGADPLRAERGGTAAAGGGAPST